MAIVKKKVVAKKKTLAVKKTAKPAAKKTITKKPMVKKAVVKKVIAAKKPVVKKIVKPIAKKAPASVVKVPVVKAVAKVPVAKKPVVKTTTPSGPLGIPELMRDAALAVLDERQAEEIVTFSLAGRSSVADYLIIASGRAGRQIAAIADYLQDAFLKAGARQVRVEGKHEANWVLIDAGDVIVHLFRPEVRNYYDLDSIWNKTAK